MPDIFGTKRATLKKSFTPKLKLVYNPRTMKKSYLITLAFAFGVTVSCLVVYAMYSSQVSSLAGMQMYSEQWMNANKQIDVYEKVWRTLAWWLVIPSGVIFVATWFYCYKSDPYDVKDND